MNVFQTLLHAWICNCVVPHVNMADESKGAIVLQGENGNECIRGNKYDFTAHTSHVIGRDSILVQLAQPFMLNSLR